MADWTSTWEAMTPDEQAAVAASVQARSDELLATGGDTSWVKTGSDLFDPETGMPKTYIPGEIDVGDTGAKVDAWGQLHPEIRELEARRTPEAFDKWKIDMGYQRQIDLIGDPNWSPHASMSLYELWDSTLRTGDPNPFVGHVLGYGPNRFDNFTGGKGGHDSGFAVGETGGDPYTSGVDDDVRADMKDAFFYALRVAGMEKDLIDKLWDWAETELVNDPSFTAERALIGMYDSEAFRTRFKAIADMTDAGYGRRDMPTPAEYINFEKDVATELSRVGVNYAGANFDNLITNLYMNSVGMGEVTERLNTAQRVMYEMPQAVRDTLTDWFSDEYGTSIAMKTFLDPTDDWSNVQDDISTAQTGGWGRMVAGLNAGWDADLAKQVSDLGMSQAEQWSRFAQLKEQEMLFTETLDETLDLDYAEEGVRAEFSLEAEEEGGLSGYELSDIISRRREGRSARFSGGGGAMVSGTTTGFGAANA